jgi:hypothetical protein
MGRLHQLTPARSDAVSPAYPTSNGDDSRGGEARQGHQRQLNGRLTMLPTDLAKGISPEAIARAKVGF